MKNLKNEALKTIATIVQSFKGWTMLFTLVLGHMVDQVGYGPFFIALGLLDLIGAAILWTLVRKPA